MSFIRTLSRRFRRLPPEEYSIEQHLPYLKSLTRPALSLVPTAGRSMSRIGGLPSLPEHIPWPEWEGAPLAFLCQIDLGELALGQDRQGLPPSGVLFFFYDQQQSTWGFDPLDKGSWRVIYTAEPMGNAAVRAAPEGLIADQLFGEIPVAFAPVVTYPSWQDPRVAALNFTDEQFEEYLDLCVSAYKGSAAHQLLGYPFPMQSNDMDLECQLVSYGLYCGDQSGYRDPRAKEQEAGRGDWMLLLQLDSDDDAGMTWGDDGMLYFWIRRSDLQEARFENCWMILQCT